MPTSARPDSRASEVLARNLAALPADVRAVLEADVRGPGRVRLDRARPAASTVITPAGRAVALHASADPVASCLPIVDQAVARGAGLVIAIGAGLGYLLDAIEQRSAPLSVMLVEPLPGVARALLARRDWSAWIGSGRLTLLVGPDYPGAASAWRLIPASGTPPTIASPVLEREFAAAAAQAKALVARIVAGARANQEAGRRFAGRYLTNTLGNIPVIAAEGDAASLDGIGAGLPAIVVGAGPSLDDVLGDLGRMAGRAAILAVDTAVRPLLAAGITPTMVVTVDPSEENARHLAGLPSVGGAWLVAEPSVDGIVLPQFEGRTFTFKVSDHHPWPWLDAHGAGRGTLRAWGSVLTTAFDLACRMECEPIVLVGADLAYTYGALYCRNTVYEPEWRHLTTREAREAAFRTFIRSRPHLTVPDLAGAPALTAPHFIQFRDWLVSQSSQVGERRVINASGAGILHGGRIRIERLGALDLEGLDAAGWHERLKAAWARGASTRADVRVRLEQALRAPLAPEVADAWAAFAGPSVTRDAIEEIRSAVCGRLSDDCRARRGGRAS